MDSHSVPEPPYRTANSMAAREHSLIPPTIKQPAPDSPSREKRPGRSRLGNFGRVVITGGSFVSLGALGFLIFLWFGQGPDSGQNAPTFWRWIVLGQRLTQAITILTLVLRVVLASQVSVCTSLVAAIVLEKHSIPLFRAAEVSLLRSANDGPLRLAWLLLKSGPRSALLPKVAITILLLLFVALQFSSTILVSDLGFTSIVGSPIDITMGTGMTDETTHQSGFPNVFAYSPVPIPFGEIQVSPGLGIQPDTAGISDTGLIRRIFPPFSAENVTSLHSYTGKAITMSSRYVCMVPSLSRLHAQTSAGTGNDSMSVSMLGEISFNKSFTDAGLDFPAHCSGGSCFNQASNFNCSLPYIPDGSESVGPASAFCLPHGVDALTFPDSFTIVDTPVSNISQIFLFYRSNSTLSTWNHNSTALGWNVTRRLPFSQGPRSSEWGTYSLHNGASVQVSLCFQQLEYEFYDVHISSGTDLSVPSLTWNPDTYEWDTTALENQYGILNHSATPSKRGLFVVNSITNGTKSAMAWCLIKELVTLIYSYPQPNNVSFFASPFAQGRTTADMANRLHAVVDHVIKDSNRPALAMQSLLTALTASALSNILALFDNVHNVTVQSSASVLVPQQVRGLTTVAVVVVTLLVTNIAITAIYIAGTKYSNRGNYWSSVAQIISDDTRNIFNWAPIESDSHVRNELKAGGGVQMRIGSSLRLERVTLRAEKQDFECRIAGQNVQEETTGERPTLAKEMTRRTW